MSYDRTHWFNILALKIGYEEKMQDRFWKDNVVQGALAAILIYSQLPQKQQEWLAERISAVHKGYKWNLLVDELVSADEFPGHLVISHAWSGPREPEVRELYRAFEVVLSPSFEMSPSAYSTHATTQVISHII